VCAFFPKEMECPGLEANIRWADVFILMYSVTDKCSFDECSRLKFLINYNKRRRRLSSTRVSFFFIFFLYSCLVVRLAAARRLLKCVYVRCCAACNKENNHITAPRTAAAASRVMCVHAKIGAEKRVLQREKNRPRPRDAVAGLKPFS
jgi:hypothetical protein